MKLLRMYSWILALYLVLGLPNLVGKNIVFSPGSTKTFTLKTGSVVDLEKIGSTSPLETVNIIIKQHDQVIIDFYAPWCGPCKQLGKTFDLVAPKYTDILILKVNVDMFPTLADHFNIASMPTLIFFKNGKQVERMSGALSQSSLTQKLNAIYG